MFHPSRGGNRGGADQFTWDEVKSDKYRENYLETKIGTSFIKPMPHFKEDIVKIEQLFELCFSRTHTNRLKNIMHSTTLNYT